MCMKQLTGTEKQQMKVKLNNLVNKVFCRGIEFTHGNSMLIQTFSEKGFKSVFSCTLLKHSGD